MQALDDLRTQCRRLHIFTELLDHVIVNIRFKQGFTNIPHRIRDVRLGDLAPTRQRPEHTRSVFASTHQTRLIPPNPRYLTPPKKTLSLTAGIRIKTKHFTHPAPLLQAKNQGFLRKFRILPLKSHYYVSLQPFLRVPVSTTPPTHNRPSSIHRPYLPDSVSPLSDTIKYEKCLAFHRKTGYPHIPCKLCSMATMFVHVVLKKHYFFNNP